MDDLVQYLGIDDRTKRSAEALWRIVDADMARVIEDFYTNTRQSAAGLGLDDATIERLKLRQKEHWRALFHSRFDREFADRASMIGLRHQQVGLSASWYIAGYSMIKLDLARIVMAAPLTLGIKTELIATLEKYVALDMACALSSYSAWLVD